MLLLHLRRYTGITDDNREDHVGPSAFWWPPDRLLFRCLELHSTHSKNQRRGQFVYGCFCPLILLSSWARQNLFGSLWLRISAP